MDDINKTTTGDIIYATVKAGLGSIPVLGSAASELFGLIVTPPLDKRRGEWMNEIADKLKALEEKGEIDFSNLSQNEQFLDTVIQATTYAIKTSEAEKIKAFKNAVINTAINEAPDKTKSQIFLNLLDGFTIWHIKIIHFFDNPKQWFVDAGQTVPNSGSLLRLLKTAFPVLQGQEELLDVIWKDLANAGFHQTSELKTMMTSEGALGHRLTHFGKEFLHFISSHE